MLWGKILGGSVAIEDAQFIHSSGSHYNSTPADARDLEQAIRRNRPDGLELVGYFRSHIRDGLCLSAQDQELITKHLHNPEYIFLLIHPFEMGICVAAFFFWQNGQLQTDGSGLEVPFLALEHDPVAENEMSVDRLEDTELTAAPELLRNRPAPVARGWPGKPARWKFK
jgi:hypothetical protein